MLYLAFTENKDEFNHSSASVFPGLGETEYCLEFYLDGGCFVMCTNVMAFV